MLTSARQTTLLLAKVALFCAAASALVLWDCLQQSRRDAANRQFQTLVGGLGLGPRADLAGCRQAFDPRLDQTCSARYDFLPAGGAFCPDHTVSVFYLPEWLFPATPGPPP